MFRMFSRLWLCLIYNHLIVNHPLMFFTRLLLLLIYVIWALFLWFYRFLMLTFMFTTLLLYTGLARRFYRCHFLPPRWSILVGVDFIIIILWGKFALVVTSDSHRLKTLILQLLINQLILFVRIVHYFFPVAVYHLALVWMRSLMKGSRWPLFWGVLFILMIWAICVLIEKRHLLIILALPLLLLLIFIPIILLLVIWALRRLFIGGMLLIIIEKVEVIRVHQRRLPGIVLILVLIIVVLRLLCMITALLLIVVIVVIVILWLIHYYIIKYYNGLSSKG